MSKLPCDECGGKCCTFPTFTKKEFEKVKAKYPIPVFAIIQDFGGAVVPRLQDGTCPFLKQGKCSIYEDRPKNCRAYGVVPQLPCMYLYPKEAVIQLHDNAEKMRRQFDS